MSDEDENYIEIEEDEEEGGKVIIFINNCYVYLLILFQDDGMNIDLNKAMKDCEGIEKVQERTNTGVVSLNINYNNYIYFMIQRQKFDSATYEKNKQEKK